MKTAACNIHSYGIAYCEEISIYISMRSIQIANETVKINFFLYFFFSLLCVGLRYRRRSTTCLRVSVWLAMCVSFRIAKQEVKQLLLFINNKQTKYEKRKKLNTHGEVLANCRVRLSKMIQKKKQTEWILTGECKPMAKRRKKKSFYFNLKCVSLICARHFS